MVEADAALRDQIGAIMRDAGYEVSIDHHEELRSILAFQPDVVILGADPPRLDCCDLLSAIKSSESTRSIRVLMLSPGGAAERTRGLDLGADDVVSLPFHPAELLSRVRAQLQNKQTQEDLSDRLEVATENRSAAQQVVKAVDEERRTLRVGGIVIAGLLIVGAVASFLLYRRTQQQNTQVYAAITRLQRGVMTEQQLIERSRQNRKDIVDGGASATPDSQKALLQKKSEDLKTKLAAGKIEDGDPVRTQLTTVVSRLEKLETEGKFAQKVIESYEPSVCLIHVVVAFRDHTTGFKLHYAGLSNAGSPVVDEQNNPLLSLTGMGPEVHLDAFGTGFLASATGQILTNHHVVEPWWQNDELKEMTDHGLEPVIVEMTAYFPNVNHGVAVKTQEISSDADVAVVKGDVAGLGIKQVAVAYGRESAVSGTAVVLLGYPTALDAILARAGEGTVQEIATSSKGEPKQVIEELARRSLIRPITTQGHIGDVLPDKIVYDAQTTSGGSGGPLFSTEGKVIGINFAMVREFGGSNFAIPVRYGKPLLR